MSNVKSVKMLNKFFSSQVLKLKNLEVVSKTKILQGYKAAKGSGISKLAYVNKSFPGTHEFLSSLKSSMYYDLKGGIKSLKAVKHGRKEVAKVLHQELVQAAGKNVSRIDKIVNLRGKGVTFRRIAGRIIPIRIK